MTVLSALLLLDHPLTHVSISTMKIDLELQKKEARGRTGPCYIPS